MPLFDNLFKAPGTPQGGLFAPDSKFRRLGGGTPAAAPAAGPPADLPQTAKKRKSAGLGEGVRKSQKVGAAEPARHGGQAPEAQGKRVKRAVKAAAAAAGHSEAQAPAVRPSVASSSPHQHAGSPPDTSAAAYTQPASGKQARSAAKAPPNGGILGEAAAAGGPAAQRGAADPLPRKRRKTAAAAAPPPRAGAGAAAAEVGGAAPVRPRAAGLDGRAANAGAGLAAAPLGHAAPDEGDEPGVGGDADEDEGTGRAEAAVAEPERTPRRTPQQEAERLARTVFVGNLAPSIKPKRVRHALARYGAVESVRLRSVPVKLDVKMPRRAAILTGNVAADRGTAHAYVVFADAAAAAAALALNMTELDGLHLRVDLAARPRGASGTAGAAADAGPGSRGARGAADPGAVLYDPARSVFVGNLPFDVQDEEVIRAFSRVGGAAAGGPAGGPGAAPAGAAAGVTAVRVVRDAKTNVGKGFAFVEFASPAAARMALALNGTEVRKRAVRVTRVAAPGKAARAGPSALTTRFNKGAQASGARGARGARAAAEPASAWQGLRTKGRGGKLAGHPAARTARGGSSGGRGGAGAAGRAPGAARGGPGSPGAGKRPAVAARKAKARGLPAAKPSAAKARAAREARKGSARKGA